MKKIEAYIQPFMLRKVVDALMAIHIHGMSVIEAKGFGKEKDESYPHHVADYVIDFTPKTKIEIICNDDQSLKIIETIQKSAHTGRKGDGKLFITDIQKAVSIRTGEENEHAI
ncbi:MAG: P-II family nitrogen regulator [Candidatus Omnitrophica bacterium]|nr:P-II family nitrogen regulator [Candidatus Omnitrophota bacterium]